MSGACSWTTTSDQGWITVTNGQGASVGTVTYDVAPNNGSAPRQGQLRINEQAVAVTQAGADCSYAVQPSSVRVEAAGGAIEVAVSTGSDCAWTASTSDAWIDLRTSNGSGSRPVTFIVADNSASGARRGNVRIAGQLVEIGQAGASEPAPEPTPAPTPAPQPGACTYALTATPERVPAAGGSVRVDVTTRTGCAWTPTSRDLWMSVPAGSKTGNGSVAVAIRDNAGAARSGRVEAGGASIVIAQDAAPRAECNYALSASPARVAGAGGTAVVSVTTAAGCSWSASTRDAWITFEPGAGTGSGSITADIQANSGAARGGRIDIANASVAISQDAGRVEQPACTYELVPSRTQLDWNSVDLSIDIRTLAHCAWTASASDTWLTPGTTNGTGSATVRVGVAANAGALRSGRVTAGTAAVTITQLARPVEPSVCAYQLNPPAATVGWGAGSIPLSVTTNGECSWSASSRDEWIVPPAGTRSGSATVSVEVAANSGAARSGQVMIGTASLIIRQEARPREEPACTFDIGASRTSFDAQAGDLTLTVSTQEGCVWSASTRDTWITIPEHRHTGRGSVSIGVQSNTGRLRTGAIVVGASSVTITQSGG